MSSFSTWEPHPPRYSLHSTVSQKKKGVLDLGNIKLLSTQWSEFVGGEDYTARLAHHLAKKFEEKHGTDLTKEDRVMERLRGFAKKAKEVLTANSETIVFMETLYNDIDFKVTVSREEFEEMCADLIEKTLEPVRAALTESKLKMKNVDALEVVGGGARVISVQDKLNQFFRKGVSHSLNGDESIALGAALHAATLSPMFRVRSFNLDDAYPFGIEFVVSGTGDTAEKSYTLFKKGGSVGVKRFVNIPRTEDFHITLKYTDDTIPREFPADGRIAQFHFKNVQESMKDFSEALEKDKDAKTKVRIGFELTSAGMLRLHSAQASLEQTVLVPIPAEREQKTNDTATEEDLKTDEQKKETEQKAEEVKYKEEKKVTKINIEYDVNSFTLPALSEDQLKEMRTRMESFERIETARQLIAKSRNELESRVYATQSLLYDEEFEPFYVEEESAKLSEVLTASDDWLMETDEDPSVTADDYKKKLQEIDALAQPIKERKEEVNKRAEQVDACKSLFKLTRGLVAEMETNSPHITEEERNNLLNAVSSTEQWIDEQMEKQKATPLNQAPIVTSTEIQTQCAKIEPLTMFLVNKPKPPPPATPAQEEDKNAETEVPKEPTPEEPTEEHPSQSEEAATPEKDEL
uniref:Uncharacterized protein n=1 Tax=Percolomonas cosmopolitus TaxID=63605 RepID=A0A7S1KSQ9_9EUKA|mmetsp:Transcript_7146/g.26774  ORF Transcript_7146/g.26774 Transcript_7146/m.26774 type:complete len:635 (+) Transcript_7146:873-2777(+)